MAALLAVTLACVLGPAAPARAVGWTPAVPLAPSSTPSPGTTIEADNVQMVVGPSGAQVITWDNREIGPDSNQCVSGEARTRLPGAEWSPTTEIGCDADILISANGTAVAIWEDNVGGGNVTLSAATAPAGSPFGAAQTVDQTDTGHDSRVAAIDGNGRVTVAWQEYRPVPGSAQYDLVAKTQNADGSWPTGRETLEVGHTGTVASNYAIAIAAGANGAVSIAASGIDPASKGGTANFKRLAAYTRLAPGGSWVKSTLLSPSQNIYLTLPLLAADPQGRVTLMDGVQRADLGGMPHKLYAWTRGANDAGWPGVPEEVSAADGGANTPLADFALDSNGNAQTAFTHSSATNYSIRAATRAAGTTTWVANSPAELGPTPCNTVSEMAAPNVAFDSFDTATISMTCTSGTLMFTRAFGSSTYSPFTPPEGGGQGVQVSTDANGYLIATWIANGVVYTSVYDAVAPSLDDFAATSTAVAGTPVSFNVTGSDVWGPVTWSVDFGDGQPAVQGRTVGSTSTLRARAVASSATSHTYANPGSYTATITVNDSAGNSVTQTRTVDVAPAATTQVTAPPLLPVPGLPDPVLGQTVNIAPIKQPVRVREVGSRRFVPLVAPKQVRVGSIIDTRKGRVRITIQNRRGTFDTADFYLGMFKVRQLARGSGFATMQLFGGNFRGCPRAPKVRISARSKKRLVRRLWADGRGQFRTQGRFSSATIRGTRWQTVDRCNGTLTQVQIGKVAVRDFVRRRTVVVRAGKRYFAAARAPRR